MIPFPNFSQIKLSFPLINKQISKANLIQQLMPLFFSLSPFSSRFVFLPSLSPAGFPAAAYAAYAAGRGFSGYPSFGLPYPTGNLNLATLHAHLAAAASVAASAASHHHTAHHPTHTNTGSTSASHVAASHHHHHTTHPLLSTCHPLHHHHHHHHPFEHLGLFSSLHHHQQPGGHHHHL